MFRFINNLFGKETKKKEEAPKFHTLYLASHKLHSRRKKLDTSMTKWVTFVPTHCKQSNKTPYFKTKIKVDISKYRYERLLDGGYLVYIPSKDHLRLMNNSSFIKRRLLQVKKSESI